MKITINDANIIIDLIKIDLFDNFLQLPMEINITNFIYDEIKDEHQLRKLSDAFQNKQIGIINLTTDDLVEAFFYKSNYNFSIQDSSCLQTAKKMNAILLTGDSLLRKAATQEKINVHGLLWIFEQLVNSKIISHLDAAQKLEMLLKINPRLPLQKCNAYIENWLQMINL